MDQSIIDNLHNGNQKDALKKLYEYFPSISKFIRQHGGSIADAEDVFQESLALLFTKTKNADFKLTASLNTYLFSICKYKWYRIAEKNKKTVSFSVEPNADVEDNQIQENKFKALDEIIKGLGQKCLQILKSFYYKKLSMKAIAQELGYATINSAKTQKYKCLERAKKQAQLLTVNAKK